MYAISPFCMFDGSHPADEQHFFHSEIVIWVIFPMVLVFEGKILEVCFLGALYLKAFLQGVFVNTGLCETTCPKAVVVQNPWIAKT